MSADIAASWFVKSMVSVTGELWRKGWHERNGGNASLRLLPEDVAPYGLAAAEGRAFAIGEHLPELAGQFYLFTGTGKYFRHIPLDPEGNLGLVQIDADGANGRILWGFRGDGLPTSEISSHLKGHRARQAATGGRARAVIHSHPTNLIALSYVLDLDVPTFTRALWEMSTECLVVFPEGVGVLPWMVPGTPSMGDATSAAMRRHALVLWPFHGAFGTGETLDEAFGLIDTAEKASEILVKVLSMGGKRHAMTSAELFDLAVRFEVSPLKEALRQEQWMPQARILGYTPTGTTSASGHAATGN